MMKKIKLVSVLILSTLCLFSCKSNAEMIDDFNAVISALETENIISADDTYLNFSRDVGLFGPESSGKFIYERTDKSHYFVTIYEECYEKSGNRWGYEYDAGETFYSISVQDCEYNPDTKFSDEYIVYINDAPVYRYLTAKEKDGLNIIDLTE